MDTKGRECQGRVEPKVALKGKDWGGTDFWCRGVACDDLIWTIVSEVGASADPTIETARAERGLHLGSVGRPTLPYLD